MAKQINVQKGSKKYRAKGLSRLRQILTRRFQRLAHSKVRIKRIDLKELTLKNKVLDNWILKSKAFETKATKIED